ncbi:hypothetical protein ACJX0J_010415, partial [Zea mays]
DRDINFLWASGSLFEHIIIIFNLFKTMLHETLNPQIQRRAVLQIDQILTTFGKITFGGKVLRCLLINMVLKYTSSKTCCITSDQIIHVATSILKELTHLEGSMLNIFPILMFMLRWYRLNLGHNMPLFRLCHTRRIFQNSGNDQLIVAHQIKEDTVGWFWHEKITRGVQEIKKEINNVDHFFFIPMPDRNLAVDGSDEIWVFA